MYSDVPATLLIPARRSDNEPRAMTKASVAAVVSGHYTEKMAERRSEFAISRLPLDELEPLIPRLTAIYFSAYRSLPEYAYEREDEVHGYLGWLAQGDPKGLFAGRHGDEIVAWMSVHGDWHGWRGDLNPAIGALQEVVIAQEWQKHGLGRRLVSLAIRHAARAGRRSIGLYVGEHNPAKMLYSRFGFTPESQYGIWIHMVRRICPGIDEDFERFGNDP